MTFKSPIVHVVAGEQAGDMKDQHRPMIEGELVAVKHLPLSADKNNIIEPRADGLYADVPISPDANNIVVREDNGVYADVPISSDPNNIVVRKTNGVYADVPISTDSGNIAVRRGNGVYVPTPPPCPCVPHPGGRTAQSAFIHETGKRKADGSLDDAYETNAFIFPPHATHFRVLKVYEEGVEARNVADTDVCTAMIAFANVKKYLNWSADITPADVVYTPFVINNAAYIPIPDWAKNYPVVLTTFMPGGDYDPTDGYIYSPDRPVLENETATDCFIQGAVTMGQMTWVLEYLTDYSANVVRPIQGCMYPVE